MIFPTVALQQRWFWMDFGRCWFAKRVWVTFVAPAFVGFMLQILIGGGTGQNKTLLITMIKKHIRHKTPATTKAHSKTGRASSSGKFHLLRGYREVGVGDSRARLTLRITFPEVRNRKGAESGLGWRNKLVLLHRTFAALWVGSSHRWMKDKMALIVARKTKPPNQQ